MKNEFEQFHFIEESEYGEFKMGGHASHTMHYDPRRLVFMLSRYKFVSKMLEGKADVLEVGCADGFGSNIVAPTVGKLTITDFDQRMVDEAQRCASKENNETSRLNLLEGKYEREVDAIYLMDVFEHIESQYENLLLENISKSLKSDGVCIIGIPSLESQVYASEGSIEGHVNCKSGDVLKELTEKYFENVFLFSANDEVIHTGYNKMAHYLIALCVAPKR